MTEIKKFEFERSRGIIWACDLVKSSKFLNDNESADALEEFLPRLYWTSVIAVEAAGGQFIKWTGDGFLAWFEIPLHRLISENISNVFRAAYLMTTLVNITQLGMKPKRFQIRHGICFEHDALLIKITHSDHQSVDLIGRAVVLAFRLSGLPSGFPCIATQKDLVAASLAPVGYSWVKRKLSAEERLKYFKGESWWTTSIYVSKNEIKKRPTSKRSVVNSIKKAVSRFETISSEDLDKNSFTAKFIDKMLNGPEWCDEAIKQYTDYTVEIYQLLKKTLPEIERVCEEHKLD